jgi:hypothetical protein
VSLRDDEEIGPPMEYLQPAAAALLQRLQRGADGASDGNTRVLVP